MKNSHWASYLGFGALLICVYYAAPVWHGTVPTRVVIYCAVSASAAGALLWGLLRYRPRPVLPWVLLGLSQGVYALADLTFYLSHYVFGNTTYPSFADIGYIGHYPLAVAGLVLLIRGRLSGRDLPGLLDALSLTAVAALLSWVVIIGPQTRSDTSMLVKLTSLAYPVMDLALLLVALRFIFAGGRRGGAFVLLVGWLAAIMAADTIYVLQRLSGDYAAGNFLDAIWLAGNLALGASALHPSMGRLVSRSANPPTSLGWTRLAILSTGALVAPALLLIQDARGELRDVPAYAIACAVLFGLVVVRLAAIAVDQRRLADTDGLTQLYTRRFFETKLERDVETARREDGALAVLMIDVDHFKAINDTYGHPVGDRVLAEIAVRLRRTVRSGELLARYGGEEFALVAYRISSEDLPLLAERLRRAVAETKVVIGPRQHVSVTVSIGAVVMSPSCNTCADLVAAADSALYTAKANGRNQVVVNGGGGNLPVRTSHGITADFLYQIADLVERRMDRCGHGSVIAEWSKTMADELGLGRCAAECAQRAARLSRIGAIMTPPDVLLKSAPLTQEDRWLLRQEPTAGCQLARVVLDHADVAQVIRQHREHWDGSGYPDGAAGGGIRMEARIVAVCEGWAAAVSPPGRVDDAVEHLMAGRGTRYDPAIVDLFLRLRQANRVGRLPEHLAGVRRMPLDPVEPSGLRTRTTLT
ncbi:diguanylate cyclase [Actinokineospora sp. 24-640]